MNHYKVVVYAICKNEEKFVKRWVDSMSEADDIFVLDTGSKDKTIKKLKKLGVHVHKKKFKTWRFDSARNESLKYVPLDTDICVCTDLDEVFEKGWRKKLENNWQKDTTKARYTYNWSLDENNNPKVSFYTEKIHSLKKYKWTHPVHEVLTFTGTDEKVITIDDIILNHYPDSSKSRSSYLKLLELSVKEEPNDDRNMHYLGREYMYYNRWNDCIDTLIKHLNLKSATWKDERCASMRFIARSYKNLKRYNEAKMWLDKAINEAPYLRDPYVERALLEYELENWNEVEKYCLEALKIANKEKTYINETFSWDETIYDLLSISCFYLNKFDQSLKYINIAIKYNPNDERLINNHKIIKEKLASINKNE
jgi:tetratricopeptide (TPR) repeat protein